MRTNVHPGRRAASERHAHEAASAPEPVVLVHQGPHRAIKTEFRGPTVLWLNPSRQRVKLSVEFSRCHYSELVKAGWIALEEV